MARSGFMAILMVVLLAFLENIAASECVQYEHFLHRVGQDGPYASEIAIEGDVALAAGQGIQVLDLSDPRSPVQRGFLDVTGAKHLRIYGQTAYGVSWSRYVVADLTDLDTPTVASFLPSLGSSPLYVHPLGPYHLVLDSHGRFHVFDPAAEPFAPPVATFEDGIEYEWAYVKDDTIFASDMENGIRVLDGSDPLDIQDGGTVFGGPLPFNDIAVQDDQIIVAADRGFPRGATIFVFDISSPTTPLQTFRYQHPFQVYSVAIDGFDVWIELSRRVVAQMDLTRASHLSQVGELWVHDEIRDLGARDGVAFSVGAGGWETIDGTSRQIVSPLVQTGGLGQIEAGGTEIKVRNGLAYVASLSNLEIYDIQDLSNVSRVGGTETGDANDVELFGNYAVVAAGLAHVKIVDVEDPRVPSVVATVNIPGGANAFDVSMAGSNAYFAAGGLTVVDLSDPESPELTGTYPTRGSSRGVFADAEHVYVADGREGLSLYALSEPDVLVGSLNFDGGWCHDVFVDDDMAYVTSDAPLSQLGLLQIVDVSTPEHPKLLSIVSLPNGTSDVHVFRNIAYVVTEVMGVIVIDVWEPTNPKVLGFAPGSIQGLEVADGRLFAVGEKLSVFPTQCDQRVGVFAGNLRASETNAGIEVSWDSQVEGKPAEFRVWRSVDSASPAELISTTVTSRSGTQSYLDHRVEPGDSWHYRVDWWGDDGELLTLGPVEATYRGTVARISLSRPYPNPFHNKTTFSLALPNSESVSLSIYDARGRLIRNVSPEGLRPGVNELFWDGVNNLGNEVSPGVYFVRVATPSGNRSIKVLKGP